MRVLIINPILYTAETDEIPTVLSIKDTMIYSLCTAFIKCGFEPVLVAASVYKPSQDEEYPFTIIWMDCVLKDICKPRYLPLLKGLVNYIRKNKNDFTYIITSEVFSMTSLTCSLWAKEKTIIWHELGAHPKLFKEIPSKFWYNVIVRLFMRNTFVVPRSGRAAAFISRYCINVSSTFIDHGVDVDKIKFSTVKDNYFVVVSQLIKRKNIDRIIQDCYFWFFVKNGPSHKLIIIGDGDQRESLQQLATNIGIETLVFFYGKLGHQELIPILNRAKALLIDTTKDNSMVSIVESIAAGTPVLTNSVPFNADYIASEKLGIVKDNWDWTDMKEICDKNDFYVQNCLAYRDKLDTGCSVRQFSLLYEQFLQSR